MRKITKITVIKHKGMFSFVNEKPVQFDSSDEDSENSSSNPDLVK